MLIIGFTIQNSVNHFSNNFLIRNQYYRIFQMNKIIHHTLLKLKLKAKHKINCFNPLTVIVPFNKSTIPKNMNVSIIKPFLNSFNLQLIQLSIHNITIFSLEKTTIKMKLLNKLFELIIDVAVIFSFYLQNKIKFFCLNQYNLLS